MGWAVAIFGGVCVVMGTSTPKPGDPQWQYAAAVAAGTVFMVAGLVVEYLRSRETDRVLNSYLAATATPTDTENTQP